MLSYGRWMLYCGRKEEAEVMPSGIFCRECCVRGYQLWKGVLSPTRNHSLGTGLCGISLSSDPENGHPSSTLGPHSYND